MKATDKNKIYFKLWRFLEFEVCGIDAIDRGKPYMLFAAAFLVLLFILFYTVQSFGFVQLIALLAR